MTKGKSVIIIGAGPAGLTAAYELSKKGCKVEVFEASNSIGGMSKSLDLWGQRVDLGPHRFFSKDPRVNSLWLEVVDGDYKMVDRLTRIYYKGKFYHYPLKPFNALFNLGIFESSLCMLSYLKEKIAPTKEDDTFENWVIRRFGRRLYRIFFKTYSEKLWGISCKELGSEFAEQRIKKLSLSSAVISAIFGDMKSKHKTLVARFAYPMNGTGSVYEKMANIIEKNGGKVNLDSPVKRVLIENNRVSGIELIDGRKVEAEVVVSTMPITTLVKTISDVPNDIIENVSKLSFRNTILVYLQSDSTSLFPDQWLYIHSPELKMGRITNFRNWVSEINGDKKESVLAIEYWANDKDKLWHQNEEDIIDLAKEEIKRTGLIRNAEIKQGKVYKIPKCYPVYKKGYRMYLESVEKYLSKISNLYPIGRYGAFKYNNQDHSILMGILASENILNNKNHNLWAINTDYEYQESSLITKTGLVKNL